MNSTIRKISISCAAVAIVLAAAGPGVAAPAALQQAKARTACNDAASTDDQTIAGCTTLIKSGHENKHNLSLDYNNRGVAFYNKGDSDHAIADFNQAITLDPNFAQAYNGRCAAQNKKGNSNMAIADCDQAIQIDPKFAYAYNNRGIAKHARGDTAGGDADIVRAHELDPNIGK